MTTKDTIKNFFLRCRYKWFKKHIKPIYFGTPKILEDFSDSTKYNISDTQWYGNKPSLVNQLTLKENVEYKNGVLNLYAKPYNKFYKKDWWEKGDYFPWSIGWIDFKDKLSETYGTWSLDMKLPKETWSAFWLLRDSYYVPETSRTYAISKISGRTIFFTTKHLLEAIDKNWFVLYDSEVIGYVKDYNILNNSITLDRDVPKYVKVFITIARDQIIPEVDIMETMRTKKNKPMLKHTIHYRYELKEYNGRSGGPWTVKPDEKWHNYACTLTSEEYKFYIDNKLVGVFTDPLSIANAKCYPIINIAVHSGRKQEELVLQVRNLRYYE